MMVPEKRRGLFGKLERPMELKKLEIFWNQWSGERTRPYNVFLRRHKLFGWESGHPLGGRMTTISSSGNRPLQNAFLTSPWRRRRLFLTASESKNQN